MFPKIFYLTCRYYDVYDSWKLDKSSNLIEIDAETNSYWDIARPSFRRRLRHLLYDFKFTMLASFLRYCELAQKRDLFYPLYFFCLYITVGPWFIGDLVPRSVSTGKRYGWVMTYGIWFKDGSWVPVFDSWLYCIIR